VAQVPAHAWGSGSRGQLTTAFPTAPLNGKQLRRRRRRLSLTLPAPAAADSSKSSSRGNGDGGSWTAEILLQLSKECLAPPCRPAGNRDSRTAGALNPKPFSVLSPCFPVPAFIATHKKGLGLASVLKHPRRFRIGLCRRVRTRCWRSWRETTWLRAARPTDCGCRVGLVLIRWLLLVQALANALLAIVAEKDLAVVGRAQQLLKTVTE